MFAEEPRALKVDSVPAAEAEGPLSPDISVRTISLDPVQTSDEPFLYRTFASTRTDEMALTGWNEEQRESFLGMQYEAQRRSYRVQLPNAEYWVIRCGETAVGRLIINRTASEIHVVDIAVLPEFRRQGIGATLMKAIMKEAAQAAKAVGLHVERFNPALHWYERLGFKVIGSGPIYLEMVWRACSGERVANRRESGSVPGFQRHVQGQRVGAAYADSD
jgi:ribosomal protein S18 acetylase RimI-like enzyme